MMIRRFRGSSNTYQATKRKKSLKLPTKLKFIVAILLLSAIVLLLRSNLLSIKAVDIKADTSGCASSDEITEAAKIKGKSFLFLDPKSAEKQVINKYPCIKEVHLSQYFPDKILIKAESRKPMFVIFLSKTNQASPSAMITFFLQNDASSSGQFNKAGDITKNPGSSTDGLAVGSDGIIFPINLADYPNVSRLVVFSAEGSIVDKLDAVAVENILKVWEKVKSMGFTIDSTWLYSQKILLLKSQTKMVFDIENLTDRQLASLQLIVDKAKDDGEQIDSIDLRFEKPIVSYIPKKRK